MPEIAKSSVVETTLLLFLDRFKPKIKKLNNSTADESLGTQIAL